MKVNKIALSAFVIAVGTLASSVAFAALDDLQIQTKNTIVTQEKESESANVDLDAGAKVTLPGTASANANASASTKTDNEEKDNRSATTSSRGDENKNETEHSAMGDAHRSAVATFVQSLLQVAGRENGIGAQVKAIAQAQNDSEKATTSAIVKVENRSGFKTFFVGTDYKSLGILRSEMVTTANQIDQLKKLADQTVNASDKTELQAQIQVLEAQQVKINAFIKAHESKFSLFGWMFR